MRSVRSRFFAFFQWGFLFSFCSFFLTCKSSPSGPDDRPFYLSVQDVSCTEAWLHVHTYARIVTREITILRDGQTAMRIGVFGSDTVVVDTALQPSRAYVYQAQQTGGSGSIEQTESVRARTLDTTSHEISWETFMLGDGASSALYDVAILNDTGAFAAGEVYKLDSLGNWDMSAFNLASWDGANWALNRVQFYDFCGQQSTGAYPTKSTFALDGSLAIISSGSQLVLFWPGHSQTLPICVPVSIYKLWGGLPLNLYSAGPAGQIGHFDGVSWQKLSSGTTSTLNDVFGGSNRLIGNDVVLIAAGNKYTGGETKLLRVDHSGVVDALPWSEPSRSRHSVWFDEHSALFTCGSGVYINYGTGWKLATEIPAIYTNSIRGNAQNDVFVAGDFGLLAHFSGVHWHVYPEVALANGNYESIAVKDNLVIAVGWSGSQAVAIVGRR